MFLILVFFLIAAVTPLPWPERPEMLRGIPVPLLTMGLVLLGMLVQLLPAVRLRAVIRLAESDRLAMLHRHIQIRRRQLFTQLATMGLIFGIAGWPDWIRDGLRVANPDGTRVLIPFGETLLIAPFFVLQIAGWMIAYWVEAAFRQAWGNPVTIRLGRYVLMHLRQQALFLMVPIAFVILQQSVARWYPEAFSSTPAQIGSLLILLLLPMVMPLVIRPMLGLKPMPDLQFSQRLRDMAARHRCGFRQVLLWPTHDTLANAMVIGMVRPFRYVVFTDRILRDLTEAEIDGVFGHELGHIYHQHFVLYSVFLVVSVVMLSAGWGIALETWLWHDRESLRSWGDWLTLGPILVLGAYLFTVFGFLSRMCERQADLFGCRVHAGDDGQVTVDGIDHFVAALRQVERINGIARNQPSPATSGIRGWFHWLRRTMGAWQHGSLADRIAFLEQLRERPEQAQSIDRTIRWASWGMVMAIVLINIAIAQVWGWEFLLKLY
ncbi:M48 family metallopeptidase [Tuwongella immobilis]|uniref:Peptidase M48 domain-containing protein n=1 Tax=Tuwongella immobilis TaxID=692036 RepID=A0A6C2YQN5_9BACT|nr:M48 family metallopeptidase [Tuwongella immobilis]VIP03667.1 peptidase m48 ste24p : Zn-dependent protease with chaperone function OS=Singulisphaera acidiphila (strain ATCC BAA-1392 / DSM 18658 / VKM B-2454 / MOB10) GN=Sinac_3192 PE=4 SV=1: Peptidase_M48 [Tuwongella immobilis]VTS04702.1 peptidase m48 ste24p : Zn-dependent protease with chaperone function OS=Singulisphaera acidiphila (strain ATCC BAA-1392 / DSM 18658 / VKM B-2454 / MOB10) GN=Sinac_3192 PE=4 SV=1: Peptidase_M48 [Tuwongella immobi